VIKSNIASLVRTSLIVAAALGGAACTPEPIPVEVAPATDQPAILDGLYLAGVRDITDTCVDAQGDTTVIASNDVLVSADLLQHPGDGLFDLHLPDTFVSLLTDLAIAEDGSVNVTREDAAGKTTVTGTITADRLTLEAKDEYGVPGVLTCATTARISGVRRPVADPHSPDGIYTAFAEIGQPNSCPVSDAVHTTATRTMDIMQVSHDRYDFNGPGFSFRTGIGEDGAVASSTAITGEVTHGIVATYTQQASGSLHAPYGQLTVEQFMPNRDGINCGQRSTLFLSKRIPDRSHAENDYRVASTMTASPGCGVIPTDMHTTVRVMTDDFGFLTLRDDIFPKGVTIKLDQDGYFSSVLKSLAADGYDLWIEGWINDGRIGYEYVSKDPATAAAERCDVRVAYDGLLRYVPLSE